MLRSLIPLLILLCSPFLQGADISVDFPAPPGSIQKIESLSYKAEITDHMTEEFKKMRGINDSSRDILKKVLEFNFIKNSYLWEISSESVDGKKERHVLGSIDGERMVCLTKSQTSMMTMTTNLRSVPDSAIYGNNPLFIAYSFLLDWGGPNNEHVVGLAEMQDEQLWKRAVEKAERMKEQEKDTVYAVTIKRGDYYDELHMKRERPYLPLYWCRRNNEGIMMRTFEVLEYAEARSHDVALSYPKRSKYSRYFWVKGMKSSILSSYSEQTITGLTLNPNLDLDKLTIDPSLADYIYDQDSQKNIQVPK